MVALMRIDTVTQGWTGGPGLNTTYWRGTGGTPTDAEADDALARVRAFWQGIRANFPTIWTAQVSGSVPIINADTGVLQSLKSRTAPAAVVGTAAGNFGPVQTMGLMQLQTATVIGGRRVRGRQYLGPVSATLTLTPGSAASMSSSVVTAGANFGTGGTGATLVIWHRPTTPGGSDGNYADVILPVGFWAQWAVLKGRRD